MLEIRTLKDLGAFYGGLSNWNAEFFITINVLMGLARPRCLRGFTGSA